MKVYSFGAPDKPVVLQFPGTCCHWKSNFFHVIPFLDTEYRVLAVSYDGFDETEQTEFPTMLKETQKIEAYVYPGRVRREYPRGIRMLTRRVICGTSGGAAEHSHEFRNSRRFGS